jgi:hypothetical protein
VAATPEASSAATPAAGLTSAAGEEPVRVGKPRLLLAILTPVNLFTGVLACGLVCVLSIWMDRRWLPVALRPPWWLTALNLVSAIVFLGLGIKGYLDNENLAVVAWSMLGIFAAAMMIALALGPRLHVRPAVQTATESGEQAP